MVLKEQNFHPVPDGLEVTWGDPRGPGCLMSRRVTRQCAYALTANVSLKGEWLYADFGHINSVTTNSFYSITPSDSVQTHMFRVGVDYRF